VAQARRKETMTTANGPDAAAARGLQPGDEAEARGGLSDVLTRRGDEERALGRPHLARWGGLSGWSAFVGTSFSRSESGNLIFR
jgi:hypothetical protein